MAFHGAKVLHIASPLSQGDKEILNDFKVSITLQDNAQEIFS
jgi:hypothetical protein